MNPRRPLLWTIQQRGFDKADRFIAAFARLGKIVPALAESGLPASCRREAMAFIRVNCGLPMPNDRKRCGRREKHPDARLVPAAWAKVRAKVEAAYQPAPTTRKSVREENLDRLRREYYQERAVAP